MATQWATPITYPSGKRGWRASPTDIPQAAVDSGRWPLCGDGNHHYNLYWFRKTDDPNDPSICKEVAGTVPPPPVPTLPKGFLDIYDPEPGPYSLKYSWRQALKTFFDDQLPPGITRGQVTELSASLEIWGLPGARVFRLHRPANKWSPEATEFRVLFLHAATRDGQLHYLDFPAVMLFDPAQIDDLAAAWQSACAFNDPGSFPPHAMFSPRLNADELRRLQEAREHGIKPIGGDTL